MAFDLATATPDTKDGFDLSTATPEKAAPDTRRKYSVGEALIEAPFNVPGGLVKVGKETVEAIRHPVDTLSGIFDLVIGGGRELTPAPIRAVIDKLDFNPQEAERISKMARSVGGAYADKYGSWEAIKRSFAEDPVSVASDLSVFLSGGAGAASKAGLAKTAAGMERAATLTNPMSIVAPVTDVAGKAVGASANYLRRVANPKAAALMDASEGKSAELINALRNYDQSVVGGQPIAGVAAAPVGATKYSALQSEVAGALPSEYYARQQANVGARSAALGTVAQDTAAMRAAETARTNAAGPLYKAAETGVADVSGVMPILDDLIAKNPGNRALTSELKQIRSDLILNKKTGALRSNAKEVTSVIDGIKARLAKEDNKFIKGELKNLREALVDTVPGYRAAQEAFAQGSKPINVMQIGQYLEGKLTPAIPTSVGERAGVFSAAVKEAPNTLKRSTGQSRFNELSDVLEPGQVKIVEGIRKDLAREAEYAAQAKAGGKSGVIPAAELAKSPAFFSKIATLANTIVDKLQGKINKAVAIELATEMLDPKLAAAALEKAAARQAKGERLADPFKRAGAATSGALRSNTGLGLRSPLMLGGVQVQNALAPENQNNLR